MSGIDRFSYSSFDPEEKREFICNYVKKNPFPATFETGYIPQTELILCRVYNGVKSVHPGGVQIIVYIGDIVDFRDFPVATNRVIKRMLDSNQIHGLDRVLYEIWKNYTVSFRGGVKKGIERIDENYTVKPIENAEQKKLF